VFIVLIGTAVGEAGYEVRTPPTPPPLPIRVVFIFLLSMNTATISFFYSAVAPDSLIAFFRHFFFFCHSAAFNGRIIFIVPG